MSEGRLVVSVTEAAELLGISRARRDGEAARLRLLIGTLAALDKTQRLCNARLATYLRTAPELYGSLQLLA